MGKEVPQEPSAVELSGRAQRPELEPGSVSPSCVWLLLFCFFPIVCFV